MADTWDGIREEWDAAVQLVNGSRSRSNEQLGATRAGLGLSQYPIALTGEPGAGKSVLFDALSGHTGVGDAESRRSPDREEGHRTFLLGSTKLRVSAMVVPGQESLQRERAMNRILSENTSPKGLIHVVCWGHNKVWDRTGQRALERNVRAPDGSISADGTRDWHLEKELVDFEKICDRIIETGAATRGLRWVIVAVTKADLFWNRIEEARDYYVPGSDSAGHHHSAESGFCTMLRDLMDHNDRLRVAVVPMSSQLIRHSFSESLAPQLSQIDSVGAGRLRESFYRTLRRLT
ncbi:hypothetical protein GCM10010329_04120 [Streptomyces spiroverticillatus]|uniref:Uncharacterized protein n=1 Tax=Streptomyces finlayi TaxID=67296 RepID=A0A919C767_9ACTN|nr:hypothetical protein [Streptomyces finlayi]GGZ87344.1 hypothetical protein GCM10010329_04120 [Streptomyces spiroverticillatus]GHC78590.1 hypothetical protein GCM10010334_04100 [Streptomyces finlayi]